MKEILILSVTALKEKLFIAFMLFVYTALDKFAVLSEMLKFYVDQFKAAYDWMDEVYKKYDHSFLTEKLQNSDKDRILAYRDIRAAIRYKATYAKDETVAEAAGILLDVMNLYGDATKMKTNERTTVLVNLIDDYESKYQEQVEMVGVGNLLTALHAKETEYYALYMEREEKDSELAQKKMAEARQGMTDAYRDLVTAINLAAKRDVEERLTEFINLINFEIRKYFAHTGQSSTSAGTGGSVDDDGNVWTKVARFEFANGSVKEFKLEVGAPLVAPANTVGYKWNREIPELMPKKSMTFKEVPVDKKKATATFHYLDHTEDEITQFVGTILHAPLNTIGCVWVPEVPATMPAVNTAYYEQPASQGGDDQQPGGDDNTNTGGNPGGGTTGGGTTGGSGDENTGGTPPEEDDPNMPPPGSGGSGFE